MAGTRFSANTRPIIWWAARRMAKATHPVRPLCGRARYGVAPIGHHVVPRCSQSAFLQGSAGWSTRNGTTRNNICDCLSEQSERSRGNCETFMPAPAPTREARGRVARARSAAAATAPGGSARSRRRPGAGARCASPRSGPGSTPAPPSHPRRDASGGRRSPRSAHPAREPSPRAADDPTKGGAWVVSSWQPADRKPPG